MGFLFMSFYFLFAFKYILHLSDNTQESLALVKFPFIDFLQLVTV